MDAEPSSEYVSGTIVAVLAAITGAWLPWVRKLPVDFRNGRALYTSEYVIGLDSGLETVDFLVVGAAIAAVGGVALAAYRGWNSDLLLVGTGVLVLFPALSRFTAYRPVERYAVEPGLYLVLAGGLFLVTIGAGALLGRVSRSSFTNRMLRSR